jgi:mannose-6-phosphate isomerase-like protein (cupin superfamily)
VTSQNIRPRQTGPILLRPGEGQHISGPEGIVIKATGEATDGSIGFVEATSQPGFAAPAHIHYDYDELFYVLDGHFQLLVGTEVVDALPGSFLFVPRGTVHAPKVVGDQIAKVLFAFVPGGAEQAFEEMAKLGPVHASNPVVMDLLQEIARRFGSEFVGPPI